MAKVSNSRWQFKDEQFGPLLPYIKDDNVTDINYNGTDVWIDDLTKGRYKADVSLSPEFVNQFSTRIADLVSDSFNQYNVLLEAETETLRISIIHESVSNTGRSISIRKTPVIKRLNKIKMINENYCSREIIDLMKKCIDAKMNMLMCGLPGTGKTELLKYLTGDIPENDRVITIEDNLEIHYAEINPGKDCVELKVDSDRFDYVKAIKACLRQNPQWILLSEARSTEVKYLIESMSTGTHCLTTIHTDDVRKVPDRIKNMVQDSVSADRIENDVYAFLDVAVLIRKSIKNGKIFRYIDQLCFFSREEKQGNVIAMVVDNGKVVSHELPTEIMRKFEIAGITNPFVNNDADYE
jgi:pilus assembly protein CpaF